MAMSVVCEVDTVNMDVAMMMLDDAAFDQNPQTSSDYFVMFLWSIRCFYVFSSLCSPRNSVRLCLI